MLSILSGVYYMQRTLARHFCEDLMALHTCDIHVRSPCANRARDCVTSSQLKAPEVRHRSEYWPCLLSSIMSSAHPRGTVAKTRQHCIRATDARLALRSGVVENRACLKMRLPKVPGNAPASFSILRSFDFRESIQSLLLSPSLHPRALLTTRHCARSILHLHPPQTQQSHQQAGRHALSRLGYSSVSEGLRSAFQGVQDYLLCRARGRSCQWQWYVHLIQGLERLSGLREG